MAAQWVHLGPSRVLVATSRGAWIQEPYPGPFGFARPMTDSLPVSVATTRRLLDGAIAAAERAAPRVRQPPMTARRWAWYLVGQWYCAHHSVALLPELAGRFETLGRADLAAFARVKLEEERGHDQFAIDDLEELGYDARALVKSVAPVPSAAATVDYARACARGREPVAFLGYMYALERRVLRLTEAWFDRLATVLPPGSPVATGLRAHATELDHAHVEEAARFIATLPARDRTAVVRACHRATEICCTPLQGEFPTEQQLADRLAPHIHQPQGVTQ